MNDVLISLFIFASAHPAADQRPEAEAGLSGGQSGGREGPLVLQKHQLQENGSRNS